MRRTFIINAFLLGIGLAMDAFSISIANGLNKPKMKNTRAFLMAFVFGLFQMIMPLIGWLIIHYLANSFVFIEKIVPYLALILLGYIGIKMIYDAIKNKEENPDIETGELLIQAVATSIDALSVGLTIANLDFLDALYEASIIGVVTFIICLMGVYVGKAGGNKFANKAPIFGGIILIVVGIKIFITGVL